MLDTSALRSEVRRTFPVVPKPVGAALSFHTDGCLHCDYLRRDLEPFDQPELPEDGIREVVAEMTSLSPQGWRWVLPSYLLSCLDDPGGILSNGTEFLIYNLAPSQEYEVETRQRLSGLDGAQIACLLHFLRWCGEHEHWGSYCPTEIARGLEFLSTCRGR